MSKALVIVVTLLYIGTAVSLYLEGNKPMALVFAGYALANVGLIWAI